MTLVVMGPVTQDLVIIEDKENSKVGGATYFQSFVFEKFCPDYLAIINCASDDFVGEFPNQDKVKVIKKDNTHFFINNYPDSNNRDVRSQSSNFANIPILKSDLENALPGDIDAFVVNPLNRYDFPAETIEYLKEFDVPIYISIQGFLRVPNIRLNDNYTIKLEDFDELSSILSGASSIFLDEREANMIGLDFDVDEMVITNGSHGSRILGDGEVKIEAVKCDEVVDTTGCGDTYMAAYISQKLLSRSSKKAATFASEIASDKIKNFGPYCWNK